MEPKDSHNISAVGHNTCMSGVSYLLFMKSSDYYENITIAVTVRDKWFTNVCDDFDKIGKLSSLLYLQKKNYLGLDGSREVCCTLIDAM